MITHRYLVNGDNLLITLTKKLADDSGVVVSGNLSINKYKEYIEAKERQEIIGWFLNDNNIVVGVTNPLTSLINSLKIMLERYEGQTNTTNQRY
jgi:hypothetical protein